MVENMEALGRTEAENMEALDNTAAGSTAVDMQLADTVAADTLVASAGTVAVGIPEVEDRQAVSAGMEVLAGMAAEDIPAESEEKLVASCKQEVPLEEVKVDKILAARR